MLIQILEEYKNRTEYKLLNNFCMYEVVSINALKKGTLVLPGIVLNKMSGYHIKTLSLWLKNKSNQLILLPAWSETNLSKSINTSVDININKTEGFYKNIPIGYMIEAKVKDNMFIENGKVCGVNYRNNLSSGLITVVTLPLLDYKLIEFQDEFKEIFIGLLQKNDDAIEDEQKENKNFSIDEIQVFLIIMLAANVNLQSQLNLSVLKYFGVKHDEEVLKEKYIQLVKGGYINDIGITDKGLTVVKEKNLKAFIDVIKERRENENG